MSKAPTFTEKQQRNTLSSKAKKKPPKAILKNILASPLPKYWPEITEEDLKEFTDILEDLKNNSSNGGFQRSTHCTIGLSASVRKLQNGLLDALLISANIKPKFVVEQIILLAMAKNSSVKIFCVPNLDKHLAPILGFSSCLCLSFSDLSTNSTFQHLKKWVLMKSKKFPIPEIILSNFENSEKNKSDVNMPVCKQTVQSNVVDYSDYSTLDNFKFTPANQNKLVQNVKKTNLNSDYISFGSNSVSTESSKYIGKETLSDLLKNKKLHAPKSVEQKVVTKNQSSLHDQSIAIKKKHKQEDGLFKYMTMSVNKVQNKPNKKKKDKKNKLNKNN